MQGLSKRCIWFSRSWLLIFVPLLLLACKKKDNEAPILSLNLIGGNNSYLFGENIQFTVSTSDNESLQSVVVGVRNAQGTSVLSTTSFPVSGVISFSGEGNIEHDNRYLVSGSYLLYAVASDGENERTIFREIFLYELPKSLERIFLMQSVDDGQCKIDSLALNGSQSLAGFVNVGLDVASCNSKDATVLLGGRQWEGMSSLDGYNLSVLSNLVTNANEGPDFFNYLLYDESNHLHYVSSQDKLIRVLRSDASVKQTINTAPYVPGTMLLLDDFLLVAERNVVGSEHRLSVYQRANGVFLQSVFLDFVPVEILLQPTLNNAIWVVGNQGNEARTLRYDVNTNEVFDPNGILQIGDLSPIISALVLPDGKFLMSQENATYVYSQECSGMGIEVGSACQQLMYEPLNDLLFLLGEGQLNVLHNNSYAILQAYNALPGKSVVAFLYNK